MSAACPLVKTDRFSRGSTGAMSCWLVAAVLLSVGCETYELRGRVVEGPGSIVRVVSAGDPRLEPAADGVPGVRVRLTADPDWLSRRVIGSDITDAQGGFVIPVDETGAGFLEIDVLLEAGAEGYDGVSKSMLLPESERRVLIMLGRSRGGGGLNDPYDDVEETIELRDEYLRRLR